MFQRHPCVFARSRRAQKKVELSVYNIDEHNSTRREEGERGGEGGRERERGGEGGGERERERESNQTTTTNNTHSHTCMEICMDWMQLVSVTISQRTVLLLSFLLRVLLGDVFCAEIPSVALKLLYVLYRVLRILRLL